jgi:Domain of unknown function (DUF222)
MSFVWCWHPRWRCPSSASLSVDIGGAALRVSCIFPLEFPSGAGGLVGGFFGTVYHPLRTVVRMDISMMTTERLEAELVAHAAWEATGLARMLTVLAEFDRRQGWGTWECRNAQHWLSWKCGLGYTAATERLRVAYALETLPAIQTAFAAGEITWSKVRELTRVAKPATEDDYLNLARCMTANQLCRVVRAKRRVDAASVATQHDTRSFGWSTNDDASVTITVRLPADRAVRVINAVTMDRPADFGRCGYAAFGV